MARSELGKRWSLGLAGWSTWVGAVALVAAWSSGRGAEGQTLGLTPEPRVQSDCGNNTGICCPGPLSWSFDPYGGCDPCGECFGEGCRGWFVAHRPATWYGSVDTVGLTMDRGTNVELARFGPTGTSALSTNDMNTEYDAGGRFTVGRTIGGCWQAEISYLGNFAWDDTRTVATSAGNLSSIFSGFPSTADATLDNNTLAHAAMSSRMATGEVNLRTWVEMPSSALDLQVLVGARYFNAGDRIQYLTSGNRTLATDVASNNANVSTGNDLYGLQIGTSAKYLAHRLIYVDFDGKVALCQNFASQDTSFTQYDGTGALTSAFATSASAHRTSLLGDLLLTVNMQFRPNLTLRAGYQAIFVNGLALGPQNLPNNYLMLSNGIGQLHDNGNAVYHGPVLGLVGTW